MVLFKISKNTKDYVFNFIYIFIAFSIFSLICSTCKPIIENVENMDDTAAAEMSNIDTPMNNETNSSGGHTHDFDHEHPSGEKINTLNQKMTDLMSQVSMVKEDVESTKEIVEMNENNIFELSVKKGMEENVVDDIKDLKVDVEGSKSNADIFKSFMDDMKTKMEELTSHVHKSTSSPPSD